MILSNSPSLSTPFSFLEEHYGDHKLSFFQLQNGDLYFLYEDNLIYIMAQIGADSKIYSSNQIKRLDVMPGITGWSQIKSKNNDSWKKKIKFDLL